jgi:hypothetical protein
MKNAFQKTLLVLALFAFSTININAQKEQVASSKYSRNSVSVHFLNFSEGNNFIKSNYIESSKNLEIPQKFDDNSIDTRILTFNGSNIFIPAVDSKLKGLSTKVEEFEKTDAYKTLLDALYANRVPNKVLNKIIIGKDGAFNSDVIFKRAEYSATDAQVISANNSSDGLSVIQNTGFDLLNNVYFLVYVPTGLSITKNKANKETDENLYSASAYSYLFKLELDKNTFWSDFYIKTPDPKKLEKLMNNQFNVKLISIANASGSSSDKELKITMEGLKVVKTYVNRPEDQINEEIISSIFTGSILSHSKNYDGFKVKTPVFDVSPIQAKIGKKENLQIDDLYQVLENREKESGEKFVKSIGYVRTKSVADNKKNADGNSETSKFYKVYAGSVKKGMIMKEVPEAGIVVGVAYDIPSSVTSVAGGPIVQFDFITHTSPGARMGLGIGGFREIESKSVMENGRDAGFNFRGTSIYGDLTFQKIIQLNMIEITPYAGAYASSMDVTKIFDDNYEIDLTDFLDDSKAKITSTNYGALAGFKAGINLGKHFQLNMGYKLGFDIGSKTKVTKSDDTNGDGVDLGYSAKFSNPSCLSFGIRLFGF